MRALVLASLLLIAEPALAETPVIAVFEIQDMRPSKARLNRKNLRALTDLLRNFLAEGGAFKVVPESGLRAAMLEAKKESYRECIDEQCQIEIGKAVSASKLVSTKIIQIGGQCIVTSTLFDLRTEATDRAEHAKGQCSEEMLATTLEKVSLKLKAERAHAELDEQTTPPQDWNPGRGKKVIASFRSEPPGALVQIDGKLACQDSSGGCRRTLTAGRHTVSMEKERYLARTEQVLIEDGSEIAWTLDPNFARLAVRTEPPGVSVSIDGQRAGRTPLESELAVGDHLIELSDDCYLKSQKRITMLRGAFDSLELDTVPRLGAIDISASDESGNAVRADVFANGKYAGRAPDLIKVNVCTTEIRVTSEEHGTWESSVAIRERETVELEAKLSKQSTPAEAASNRPPEHHQQPPPGVGVRLGAQAMLGIVCLEFTGSGTGRNCVDWSTGYGGLFALQWPTKRSSEAQNWYVRAIVRGGFLYYPGAGVGPALFEVPAGVAGEFGLGGPAFEYAVGAEGLYVFRKFARLHQSDPDFEIRRTASPHAVDIGLYLVLRLTSFDLGGGVYLPLTGIGEPVLGRMWIGYAFDL